MTPEILAKWQKILRLQDWVVTLKEVKSKDMDSKYVSATIETHADKKRARIEYLPLEEQAEDHFETRDVERNLVHELLHLHFDPFDTDPNTPERLAEEQAVSSLADALIALDRRK